MAKFKWIKTSEQAYRARLSKSVKLEAWTVKDYTNSKQQLVWFAGVWWKGRYIDYWSGFRTAKAAMTHAEKQGANLARDLHKAFA